VLKFACVSFGDENCFLWPSVTDRGAGRGNKVGHEEKIEFSKLEIEEKEEATD